MTEIYCHGVGITGEGGHYLFNQKMWSISPYSSKSLPEDFPCGVAHLDGCFLPPKGPQVEGVSSLWHVNDWAVLAFWDRSGDERGNSNSAFVIRGQMVGFVQACRIAREAFPEIWERMAFEVTER